MASESSIPCDARGFISEGCVLVVGGRATDPDVLAAADALRGITEITVSSGREAAALLERLDADLIIADEDLGIQSGREFLESAASIRPVAARVLLRSARDSTDAAGAADIAFVGKPVDRHALRALVTFALRTASLQRSLRTLEEEKRRPRFGGAGSFEGTEEVESYEGLLIGSPAMRGIMRTLQELEDSDVTVVIEGETGTGKDVVARAIHRRSRRRRGPFVAVNLGAISDHLRESELFGHVRGAFTGATDDRRGRFVEANRGSLFLDEVGEASPALQVALLRVLEEGTITPVGADRPRAVDVRIISATNRPLEELVRQGRFRRDLYYRLNVFPIRLPPLRERPVDIVPLAIHFLRVAAERLGRRTPELSRDARVALESYRWDGNVRELRNAMERAVIVCRGNVIVRGDLPIFPRERTGWAAESGIEFPVGVTLLDLEREIFRRTLTLTDGNQSRAARMLGLNESTFRFRLRKLGIPAREGS